MVLILGGRAQGKLSYAMETYCLKKEQVFDGENGPLDRLDGYSAIDRLDRLIGRLMQEGKEPEDVICTYLAEHPDAVLITDEIGCGVVPMDAFLRDWREKTGRVCCMLAKRADRVERVFAGIATTLKG